MAGHEWEDWFEREEFIGQISDMRVQNLQVEREVVQKRTFTRWINLHLEKCYPPIEVHDLFKDVQDGHVLMALLEELSGCKLLHGFKKSSHRIFRLNNIAKVLSFLEQRNVKLVSIDAADVADGHSSIILGLIWNIILFFQIKELTGNIRCQFPSLSSSSSSSCSSSSFSSAPTSLDSLPPDQPGSTAQREQSRAIKKLLHWVQKRTRQFGVAVLDFGRSWRSGLVFLAVIKSIDPSLVDMRKALLRSARENLEEAFRVAHYGLGIPRLLEPEDVTVSAPDEQSIMIYVSQFLEHFPDVEQAEEPRQLDRRSVSLSRLNSHDGDWRPAGPGPTRNLPRQWSCGVQGDAYRPCSKVPEDSRSMTLPLRPATSRSSEDLLGEPWPSGGDVADQLQGVSCVSPSVPCPESSTGSSVLDSLTSDSLTCNSALESPDSWADSDSAVVVETFGEDQRVCAACDCGPPAGGSAVEEETQPAGPEPAPAGSQAGEGLDLASWRTGEELQGDAAHHEAVEEKVEDVSSENQVLNPNQAQEPTAGCRAEATDLIHHEQVEPRWVPAEGALPLGPADGGEPISRRDEAGGTTPSQRQGNTEVPTLEEAKEPNVKESLDSGTPEKVDGRTDQIDAAGSEAQLGGNTGNQDPVEPPEDVEPDLKSHTGSTSKAPLDLQGSFRPQTAEASAPPAHQVPPSPAPADPSQRRSSTLHSTSAEPVEQQVGRLCDVTKETEHLSDFSCPPTDGGDENVGEDVSLPGTGNDEPSSEAMLLLGGGPVQDGEGQGSGVRAPEQEALDPADLDQSCLRSSSSEDEVLAAGTEGGGPQAFDSGGGSVEPMDIFYPEKEEPESAEPVDVEPQGWPLVLSVSALQPAPATGEPPDGHALDLVDQDPLTVEGSGAGNQEGGLLVVKDPRSLWAFAPPDTGGASESESAGMASAGEHTQPDRGRKSLNVQCEGQTPAAVRDKEDWDVSAPTVNQAPVARDAGTEEVCSSSDLELHLLLLLWMLLYCLWLLPRMDVKQLPHLLLNL